MRLITSYVIRISRKYGTRPKYCIDLDKNVKDALETGICKPKRHEGIIRSEIIQIPDEIVNNIRLCTQDHPAKTLILEGHKLKQYLHSRHLPLENQELNNKIVKASRRIERKLGVDMSESTEEERQNFRNKYKNEIKKALKHITYSWKAIDYDDFQSKVYLFGRSAANYAVLYKIFLEMKTRLSDFQPKSLFDFGSGVGTVSWAANAFWKDSLHEYFCVDSSSSMNDLSSSIIQGPNDSSEHMKGFFYRQFLPQSQSVHYDLVVSAHSLFELPNLKSRFETILTLWKKTSNYLIIVEEGTNNGFQVINEARDFILEISRDSKNESDYAHVFAPCPHDEQCPRFMNDYSPCNFEVSYFNPFKTNPSQPAKERFSYVVLKKGSRQPEDKKWPRVVRQVLPRSRHVVCRLCTSQGTLEEIVFTASKHGKLPYKCARVSKWGDLLPFTVSKEESSRNNSENSVIEEVPKK